MGVQGGALSKRIRRGEGFGVTVEAAVALSPSSAMLPRGCPCEGARDRKRRRRSSRREGRQRGQRASPILLTTDQSGGVLCCLGGNRVGEERRRWRRADKQGKKEGGWTARRIPRVNYPREGGTVTNTLHLICKAAAEVHLSTASERPATALRQLMSPFNDMCCSVWQWPGGCGLGQMAKREGLSSASCLPTETNFTQRHTP